MINKDKLIEVLNKYFSIDDTYAYWLTRDKSSFSYGTVTIDDFSEFDEFNIDDLSEYIIDNYK